MNTACSGPRVVGLGEILWDMLPGGKQLGGAPANFAYHAEALGAQAFAASCVGSDGLGAEIRRRLHNLGMSDRYVAADSAHPTGTVDVALDSQGVPTFTIRENVAWDFIPFTAELAELAGRADAVCFGSLAQRAAGSRQAIRRFLGAVRRGCLRIFDINLRQSWYSRQIVHESLELCDVLKLNDSELPVVAQLLRLPEQEESTVRELMSRYRLHVVALTRGGNGSRLYVGGELSDHPGCPTRVLDTVGAGDAFTAALAMGLLRGDAPARINERANRLASYVCSQAGATPQIPGNVIE